MGQCPVCNAYTDLTESCPECSDTLEDLGRIYDYYTPYSAYREIDDAKLTNNVYDASRGECLHYMCCPTCAYEKIVPIREVHHE